MNRQLLFSPVLKNIVLSLVCLFFVISFAANAANESEGKAQVPPQGPPAWFAEYLAYFTQAGGCWITSNDAYRSAQETTDSYVVQWNYAISKQSKRASLYGIDDGERTSDFWEMHVYWDGIFQSIRVDQFGHHGIVGHAELVRQKKGVMEQNMTFALTDGRSWKDRHIIELLDDSHKTTSYEWEGEQWVQKRSYIWQRCDASLAN